MATGTTQLEQLKQFTKVVADTGDFESMKAFKPEDATTNPSLLLKAANMEEYKALVDEAVAYGKAKGGDRKAQLKIILDKMAVNFGLEILKIVPGLVSTELDARLSFSTDACIARAREIIALYEEAGVKRDRILIKIASTWEGLCAAKVLQAEGIQCNLTLLFSIWQAAAAAEFGCTLISPFVGRIMDWFKKDRGVDSIPVEEDPGVASVTSIYKYYKTHGFTTTVMGASFRSKGEILALAGCDKLTIAPKFLKALEECTEPIKRCLNPEDKDGPARMEVTEANFRWGMNQDAMATEKLAEGIRKFAVDTVKLEAIVEARLDADGGEKRAAEEESEAAKQQQTS